MILKFIETEGKESSIIFNPTVTTDTNKIRLMKTILIMRGESFPMPEAIVPNGGRLWISEGAYSDRARVPGDYLVVWPVRDEMRVVRYYPAELKKSFWEKMKAWRPGK